MDKEEKKTHWADEKEVVKTNTPLKFTLLLVKHIPSWLLRLFIYPVGFFFFLFSARSRSEAHLYQKQLRTFTKGDSPRLLNSCHQIVSFAFCVVEKMEGWLGKFKFQNVEYQNDDIDNILADLREGKGVFIFTSHLGNMELLRSLSENNRQLVGRDVPVWVVMDTKVTTQFSSTLSSINEKVDFNIVDASSIGPDSMVTFMDAVENGGMVVIAGDRTSANNRDKIIKQSFLGKEAPFPYGSFLIPFLLKVPVYYLFAFRKHTSLCAPKYEFYIEKSQIDFNCGRAKREEYIKACCAEYAGKLEKFCAMYPYQWYNFFNFWNMEL